MGLETVDEPDPADVEFLHQRLDEDNAAVTGLHDGRTLTVVWRADDEILGGLHGWTWGRSAWIDVMWVAASQRSAGIGSALLTAAEAEVQARGCRQVALATHTFQARGFYERHGYEVTGYLDGHPEGHGEYTMRKRLD